MVQLLWTTVWQFPYRLIIDLLYDPMIPPLDIYSKEMKTHVQAMNLYINVNNSNIKNSQKVETTQVTTKR